MSFLLCFCQNFAVLLVVNMFEQAVELSDAYPPGAPVHPPKEYRHYAVEGDPGHYSECLYNIEEIMRWIENQKQPGAKNASSG